MIAIKRQTLRIKAKALLNEHVYSVFRIPRRFATRSPKGFLFCRLLRLNMVGNYPLSRGIFLGFCLIRPMRKFSCPTFTIFDQ